MFWTWAVSSQEVMGVTEAHRVMGTAMTSRRLRMAPGASGTSVGWLGSLRRRMTCSPMR